MNRERQHRWPRFLLGAVAFLFVSALRAQSPLGPEFLVNPQSVGLQHLPDLQFGGDGELWIAWLDNPNDTASSDRLLARAVSPQGELAPPLVLVDTSGDPPTLIQDPLVIPLRGGDIRLFYTRSTGTGFDQVHTQRFDPSGRALGERVTLTPPPPLSAIISAAVQLPAGGFAVMTFGFPCLSCPGNSSGSVSARILAPDGSPVSRYLRVPRPSERAISGVRGLAVDGRGNLIFVWSHANGDPGSRDYSDIDVRRFSSQGVPVGQELVVNTTIRGTQYAPSVAADAGGDFVVVWQTQYPGGLLRSIFGQRFSKAGEKVGPEFRINEERFEKDFGPSVAMDRDGNFVVVWQSFSPSPTRAPCGQVRMRLYRRDGTPAGPELPVAPGYAACGEEPKVAFGPDGIFAVAWAVDQGYSPETGDDFDVYAARFSVAPALP
jgi:hypothetical protein